MGLYELETVGPVEFPALDLSLLVIFTVPNTTTPGPKLAGLDQIWEAVHVTDMLVNLCFLFKLHRNFKLSRKRYFAFVIIY